MKNSSTAQARKPGLRHVLSSSSAQHNIDAAPPTDAELAARFRPIFARIAAGAVEREIERRLPFTEVGWLRDAGFGKVRVPQRYGGLGATLPQFFSLLTELAEADSNISHLLRGHFSFLEGRLNHPDESVREFWFPKVADGALLGYAMAELTAVTGTSATIEKEGDHWRLNGKKYYSTGTIYADWIVVTVAEGAERVSVALPATLEGITRLDDWDGFGQRMTGSGTTIFENVKIDASHIIRRFSKPAPAADKLANPYQKAFLQLVLLSSITGAGRAVLRDAIDFAQRKTRAFNVQGESRPREDPLVQRVVGRIASLSFAADSMVEAVARAMEDVYRQVQAGTADETLLVKTEIKAFEAQQMVIDLVLQECTLLFEVGGASATSEKRRLDRHWRNVRTAASHNPAIFRERAIGDYYLNGAIPDAAFIAALEKESEAEQAVQAVQDAPAATSASASASVPADDAVAHSAT